ncbi:hypothetical protein BC835DRAFT_1267788 [Cytidiella melzeri]|nr:hypothetical protein BC835DRAFT_1267788 [Cytidiella melzeri]
MGTLFRPLRLPANLTRRTTFRPLSSQYLFSSHHTGETFTTRVVPNRPQPLLSESSLLQFLQDRVRLASQTSRFSRSSGVRNASQTRSNNGGRSQQKPGLDGVPDSVVIWGVLGLNGLVFLTWQKARSDLQNGDPTLTRWLMKNFTVSLDNIRDGRIWTLLSCCFSHEGAAHIFVNAFTFYFMAPPVLGVLGKRSFLLLYLGGGIFSSLSSMWFNNVVLPKPHYSSHGASGAMYSVISFLACLAPSLKFQLWGVIPIPAWLFVSGVFAMDTYSALENKRAGTDTAGHVAGILGGIAFYLGKRFRVI